MFGEGPANAGVMFVGKQPGDQEDVIGRPFVGPAGQIMDRAMEEAGIDRRTVYITNAVKHFKFEPRGKLLPRIDYEYVLLAVTMLPKMASTAIPRSFTSPPQRACRISAFQSTIRTAPFSFGSQPQNRPHDWSAQMPAQHRPDEAQQRGEADDPVDHPAEHLPRRRPRRRGGEHPGQDVRDRDHPGDEVAMYPR